MDRGVLYIAAGERYIAEMLESVRTLRRFHPEIPVTAVTDREVDSELVSNNVVSSDFNYDMGDSIVRPEHLPYERTLFLDVDTWIADDISELFVLLDGFDIAAAHNPERITDWFEDETSYSASDVPDCFPQYNTGVLLLRNNRRVKQLLENWLRYYDESEKHGFKFNQPAFREALYKSELRIATLTPEYNVRINRPGYLNGPAKILHDHHPKKDAVSERLNATYRPRTYSLDKWPIETTVHKTSLRYMFLKSIKMNGWVETLKRGPRWFYQKRIRK